MRHVAVTTDLSTATDPVVGFAAGLADVDGGRLVIIAVLPGSTIDGALPPLERGRARRREEDRAESSARAQVDRMDVQVPVRVVSLFGDPASDTLLVAHNMRVDALVVPADHPALVEIIETSEVPVVTVPAPSRGLGSRPSG